MEKTINEVFRNRVKKYGDRLAVEKRIGDVWEAATFNEFYERSRAAGLGLYELGVRKGDRVAILSENRLEWLYTDMGGFGIGACVFGIYATVNSEEVEVILKNSGANVIVVENPVQLSKAIEAKKNCRDLRVIIIIEDKENKANGTTIIKFADLMKKGRNKHQAEPALFEKLSNEVGPEDLALLQYTSGTTGVPKGVMITHGNIMSSLQALDAVEPQYGYDTDHVISFLPLSHIFERVPGHLYVIYKGITKHMAGNLETLVEDIQTTKPTIMFAVPRVLEKIYQKMVLTIREKPAAVQKIFAWAQSVGNDVSRCNEIKKPVPFSLRFKHKIAYALVFKKLQHALGGRIRWICAAGAPIAREIVNFFNAAGIFILEGWGMSEVTGGGTLSNLDDFSPGSVGRPLPWLDVKIAEDGEILVKGPMVFKGYYNMPEETKEAFTTDGYFMTGDIGMFDERGLMYITDRKKDLIITAGGKNVAPQKIEAIFKENPLFTQVVVIGDRRKYLTALFNIDLPIAKRLAMENGINTGNDNTFIDSPEFKQILDSAVEERNSHLGKVETIKYYTIIKNDFSKETGELTNTLKVRRKTVMEKYAKEIEEMYRGA